MKLLKQINTSMPNLGQVNMSIYKYSDRNYKVLISYTAFGEHEMEIHKFDSYKKAYKFITQ